MGAHCGQLGAIATVTAYLAERRPQVGYAPPRAGYLAPARLTEAVERLVRLDNC